KRLAGVGTRLRIGSGNVIEADVPRAIAAGKKLLALDVRARTEGVPAADVRRRGEVLEIVQGTEQRGVLRHTGETGDADDRKHGELLALNHVSLDARLAEEHRRIERRVVRRQVRAVEGELHVEDGTGAEQVRVAEHEVAIAIEQGSIDFRQRG